MFTSAEFVAITREWLENMESICAGAVLRTMHKKLVSKNLTKKKEVLRND